MKAYRLGNGAVFEAVKGTTESSFKGFLIALKRDYPTMSAIDLFVRDEKEVLAAMWETNGVPFPNATYPKFDSSVVYGVLSQQVHQPLSRKVYLSSSMDENKVQFWENLARMADLSTESYDEEQAEYGQIDELSRDEKMAEEVAARRQQEEGERRAADAADAAASGSK